MFKDKWFILAIIATVFLGLCIVFSGGVYTMGQAKEGIFYRINRFTGETWLGNNVEPRKVEYESRSKESPFKSNFEKDFGHLPDGETTPPAPIKPFVDDLSLGAPKAKNK